MEPLVALGLAANIVQLINFTTELVSKGHEMHRSDDGALVENSELQAVTENLQMLASQLYIRGDRQIN
jgi:hypothetical protein